MDKQILHIKNMVCPRCIMAVEGALKEYGISFQNVELGQVTLSGPMSPDTREQFGTKLETLGFELLEPGKSTLISKIKTLIIEQVHYSTEPLAVNFSTYLSEKLNYEYSSLSRLFSSVEGVTIERYVTLQKIEKVKELLFYDELSLSEVAFQMNYSSVAYLSTQFKKETGMTPTQFKQSHKPGLRHLDSL
ncbi:MAG: AraC family transcriptional regulator [Bacteroidales bacterium]